MDSGFLLVHKPSGITSFDVIRQLRRILGIKKLGHSGVLDRPASGLLVVGVNQATRLFELFATFKKEYEADLWLGLSTQTDDLCGELVAATDPAAVTKAQFEAALAKYRGTFAQVPPAYSLAKKAGKEAYRYALAGRAVEIEARQVTIHASKLLSFEQGLSAQDAIADPDTSAADGKLAPDVAQLPPLVRARIWLQCSGGLYVRALARDIGSDLGVGGAMGRLVRTRVGPFLLAAAHTLESLEQQVASGATTTELLHPLSSVVPPEQSLTLDDTQIGMVRMGQRIRTKPEKLGNFDPQQASTVYGLSENAELVALLTTGQLDEQGLVELKPAKVFP